MIEQDTIRLMRQCGAGIKMGISAIDEVYDLICSENFRLVLDKCRTTHEKLGTELTMLLHEYGQEEKELCPLVRGMACIKTKLSLKMDRSEKAIADMLTDGTDMGIKNLYRFLNKYRAADERSKDITKRLCDSEEQLVSAIRPFL